MEKFTREARLRMTDAEQDEALLRDQAGLLAWVNEAAAREDAEFDD